MFYVYEWFNVDTNFVFYVGKGCGNRCKSIRGRNKLFKEYIQNNNCNYRIVKFFDSEDDSFNYENKRILELKEINQATCNLDYGGKGGTNFCWTPEMRKYKSLYNPMKEEKQRKRLSENNPMKRKEIVKKVSEKNSRAVIINGIEYSSVKRASIELKVKDSTIIKWCKKGVDYNLQPCRYKDSEQAKFTGIRYNKGGCRPIVYKGVWYESAVDIAKELHLNYTTIHKYAKRGFDNEGNECRYEDDKSEHTYKPVHIGKWNNKAIIVNGKLYPSKADAEKALGLCRGYLSPYIAGIRKNQKYICQYANQQPSQGNTDKSTLEGSTTNG